MNILAAAGVREDEAEVIAGFLVEANLRGVDGHGVLRLLQYVESIRDGHINTHPAIDVARRGATAVVDADGGYGFSPSIRAMDVAVEIASEVGVGAVSVANSHHFGMASFYARRAAEAGCAGIAMTNTLAVMPAPRGLTPVVGNDPISIAVPRTQREPVVVDLALTEASWGKISLAAARGESIPDGWALDATGRPTVSAPDALAANLLVPIGGHKGFALAVLLELLVAGLTGAPVGPDADGHSHRPGGCGHLLIALHPDWFGGRETLSARIESLAAAIAGSPTTDGSIPVLPGERSARIHADRTSSGVPFPEDVRIKLNELAFDLGVEPL